MMRRITLKVVAWYGIYMVVVTAIYLGYRQRFGDPKYLLVEPKYEERGFPNLNVPFLRTTVETPKPYQPYFIGDSVVIVAKGYPKAVFPGSGARGIARKVSEIPQVDYPFDIIVMAGMVDLRRGAQKPEIDRGLKELHEVLHDRFPNCSITIIHPTELYQLATSHGYDKWHINQKGFDILASRYSLSGPSSQ
jgi:hypothetical protein